MIDFSVPTLRGSFIDFSVTCGPVLFAGSRHGHVREETSRLLLERFGKEDFTFLTGCASGIDASFRKAFTTLDPARHFSQVACAFRTRVDQLKGTHNLYVVPQGLPPRVALARQAVS